MVEESRETGIIANAAGDGLRIPITLYFSLES